MNEIASNLNEASVLIIDDDAMVAQVLSDQLFHLGGKSVTTAQTSEIALSILGDHEFDYIFCDLAMPGRDGVETMRAMAELGTQAHIILSSGADISVLQSARELGESRGLQVKGCLRKPFGLSALKDFFSAPWRAQHTRQKAGLHLSECVRQLAKAIECDQLSLYYQPQVNLATLKITGVEALIRWNHPEYGLLLPETFLPVAESTDLIGPLTQWVIQEAIDQCERWSSEGRELDVAINLSGKSLRNLDLPDELISAVTIAGLKPARLTLEVTETVVAEDLEALLDITTRLRLKGFSLSIDDFGTGAANLNQLQRLPFTELKLASLLTSAAVESEEAAAVLETSVKLARQLRLKTVAEGIETQEEWNLLKSLHVDCGQGYLVARPLPPADLPECLQSWQGRVAENDSLLQVS